MRGKVIKRRLKWTKDVEKVADKKLEQQYKREFGSDISFFDRYRFVWNRDLNVRREGHELFIRCCTSG